MRRLEAWFIQRWYSAHPISWALLPASLLYQLCTWLRRAYLRRFRQQQFAVPIIVVGNLTVGGVGKTPLVIALAKALSARGLRVGVVSRGYGASVTHFPYEVTKDAAALDVGDEPLLIAKQTGCPVVIAPKRADAVRHLLAHHNSQIIISDDGLQHYAMGRAIEIVVIDGARGVGNGFCLPAGPLRERAARLKEADFIIVNGKLEASTGLANLPFHRMDLLPGEITQLVSNKPIPTEKLNNPIAAMAGIGNPQRFFATLTSLGVEFKPYPFPDHHQFKFEELNVPEKIVVMTEKDAVKCQPFATDAMYFLPVEASIDDKFWDAFWLHRQLQGYV